MSLSSARRQREAAKAGSGGGDSGRRRAGVQKSIGCYSGLKQIVWRLQNTLSMVIGFMMHGVLTKNSSGARGSTAIDDTVPEERMNIASDILCSTGG